MLLVSSKQLQNNINMPNTEQIENILQELPVYTTLALAIAGGINVGDLFLLVTTVPAVGSYGIVVKRTA